MADDSANVVIGGEHIDAVADVVTFVDEAGYSSRVRKLTPARDAEIGLMCALPIPAQHVDLVRSLVKPFYDEFCDKAPPGAKLHITDAFKPGHDQWRAAAEYARNGIFDLAREIQLRVVYSAKRARLPREAYQRLQQLKAQAMASSPSIVASKYRLSNDDRAGNALIYDHVMTDLTIWLDGFMENANYKLSDIHFDEIDKSLAENYSSLIEQTRNISSSSHEIKARNLQTREDETRTLTFETKADFELNVTRIGKIVVAGKSDPLVFAVDVVANSLWRHLKLLPADAHINSFSSVSGWALESIVCGDRSPDAPPSLTDLI